MSVLQNGRQLFSVGLLLHRSACLQLMEDLMDIDMSPLRPLNYLFGCELKADKDCPFKVDNDENEHQLSLRMVSLGAGAKDELYTVEAEAMNYEGSPIKVTLATLKMSVQLTVSLGGFEITLPLLLRLKCGSGPVHISGQHLVAGEEDAELDEYEEDVKLLGMSGKRSAPGGDNKVPQRKVKLDEDDDEDDEDDEDNEEDDDFDEEETEEKVTVKKSVQDTPDKNAQNSNQNGKDLKPSIPRSKGQQSFKKQEKTPKTPKGPRSVEDIRAKVQASIQKRGSLPKVEAKFINYVKNYFRVTDQEAIQDQWRKSL
ncbi:nucleophosmin-like [Rattus rattus]|uniref:nucleophosmin-like n=1 Tax=Rattus rattus TaxID=10117 RepID=UPI0013F355EA|nr:nucleophosmin-like [Rattus rattus]